VKFSIRSLLLLVLLAAVGLSGLRWWLLVSEERRLLHSFDPTLNEIFDWPEDRQELAKPVLDEMRAELLDAAWFGSEEQKLAICHRYADILAQRHDRWDRPDLGRAFAHLGDILGFPQENTDQLAGQLGFDAARDRRIMMELYQPALRTP
jgi:hypothetical protein